MDFLTQVPTFTAPIVTGSDNITAPLPTLSTLPTTQSNNGGFFNNLLSNLPQLIDVVRPLTNPGTQFQTPGIVSPIQVQNNLGSNSVNNNATAVQNRGFGDFVADNKIAFGIGALALGFVGYKLLKK